LDPDYLMREGVYTSGHMGG